jgi:hypothetical protein
MATGDGNNPVPVYVPANPQPTPPAASAPKRSFDEALEELWSVRLPAWLDHWSPQVADALADGSWTAAVRGVAAYAPIAAFGIGLLSRLIFPGLDIVYTESLLFMLVVIALSILSGTMGVGLLAGYIIQDLVLGNRVPTFAASPPGVLGGKMITWFLLALPAIVLPLLARQLTGAVQLRQLADPKLRTAGYVVLNAVVIGALIYLWTQSLLVLVRPLFSLVGAELPVQVVLPVQSQAFWLVLVAMLAAAIRETAIHLYVARSPRPAVVANLQRWRLTGEKQGIIDRMPEMVRVVIATTVLTIILTGTYESWFDVLISALIIGLVGAWRANLIRMIPIPAKWALMIRRYPPLLRLLAAVMIGYVLSAIIVAGLWGPLGGLRLLMIGSLLTLIVFNLVFPPLPVMPPQQPTPQPQTMVPQ